MTYLYLTKSGYLCTSKRSNFTNCYKNTSVAIPDANPDNGITYQLLCQFSVVISDLEETDGIKLNPMPMRYNDPMNQKMFLRALGIGEAYINAEYASIQAKYDSYYTRIEEAYNLFNSI